MVKEHRTSFGDGAGCELGDDLDNENKAARAERRRRLKGARVKRFCALSSFFLLVVSAARAGVGPGVASELPVTSPLMGNGGTIPQLTFPSPHVIPAPVYTPAPHHQPGPAPLHVVSPLPGGSPAPVAVTVGPAIAPQQYTPAPVQAVSPLPGTSLAPVTVTIGPTVAPQHACVAGCTTFTFRAEE